MHAQKRENHAFDFSWSLWLAVWFAGAIRTQDVVQHNGHTPEIGYINFQVNAR